MVLLDILEQRGIVALARGSDLFHVAVGPVEEAAGLPEDPAPFRELNLSPLQGFVAFVESRHTLLEALGSLSQLIDLGGRGRGQPVGVEIDLPMVYGGLLHLGLEVACPNVSGLLSRRPWVLRISSSEGWTREYARSCRSTLSRRRMS